MNNYLNKVNIYFEIKRLFVNSWGVASRGTLFIKAVKRFLKQLPEVKIL